jgi:DNA (cytosine-5)-methyltransferase 1
MEDIVRRLTPLECERLQGYPDNWTLIGEPKMVEVKDYNVKYDENFNVIEKEFIGTHEEEIYVYKDDKGKEVKVTDSVRYKALGNSIALPQWWWLICKMEKYLPDQPKLGSLFDGIGGFPLVFETKYGKGSARWASEIEPFPIAVTKYRFPEGEEE